MWGLIFPEVSPDIWNVLIDKAEIKAYDMIEMVTRARESLRMESCTVDSQMPRD